MAHFANSLLAVIVVATATFFVFYPNEFDERGRSIRATLFDLENLRSAIAIFEKRQKRIPTAEEGLRPLLLVNPPMLSKLPTDPWGHPYLYRGSANGAGYLVYSSGKNGVDEHGAGDDITDKAKNYTCSDYGVNCPIENVAWAALLLLGCGLAALATLIVRLGRIAVRKARAASAA